MRQDSQHTIHCPFLSFQRGEENGFRHYFGLYYRELVFFAGQTLKDTEQAGDIVGDSFLKLFEKRQTIQSEATLKGFLYTMVKNACLDRLRQQKNRTAHHRQMAYLNSAEERTVLENLIRAETLARVIKAMEELPAATRNVFRLIYMEGKTYDEIARETGRSKETIRKQKQQGLSMLKKKLLSVLFLLGT